MGTNSKTKKQIPVKPAVQNKRRDISVWLLRNGILLFVGYMLITKIPPMNPVYTWLHENYLKNNMEIIKASQGLSNDDILKSKLGADYDFLLYIRKVTPEDAVVYWPSSGDFRAGHPSVPQNPFNGKLNDKLTAVRVLYPRRVVTEDEYGKTSWTKKITHVAIVNGKNKEKLPYPVGDDIAFSVLPTKPVKQQPVETENNNEPSTTAQQ